MNRPARTLASGESTYVPDQYLVRVQIAQTYLGAFPRTTVRFTKIAPSRSVAGLVRAAIRRAGAPSAVWYPRGGIPFDVFSGRPANAEKYLDFRPRCAALSRDAVC